MSEELNVQGEVSAFQHLTLKKSTNKYLYIAKYSSKGKEIIIEPEMGAKRRV